METMMPLRRGSLRFAVGHPAGVSSNSWIVWTRKTGDVYISCRDNFTEAKVSLHASGRWRMAFTETAVVKNSNLLSPEGKRTWDVWDAPPPPYPNAVAAFHLIFPSGELAVRPERRHAKDWGRVLFIEAAPPGQMLLVTLFLTINQPTLTPDGGGPSRTLASLSIGNGRFAQVVTYGTPEGDLPALIEQWSLQERTRAQQENRVIPREAYGYLFGKHDDGVRYIVGARLFRTPDALPDATQQSTRQPTPTKN